MKLDDEYFIDTDAYQFRLCQRTIGQKGKSEGKEVINTISYHRKLNHLLHKYLEIQLLKADVDHINNVIKLIEQLNNKVDEISENINITLWNKTIVK